jgi:hypothetical protein
MSCPLERVLARAVERHVFRLGGSDLSFWMRNPFERFKWQLVVPGKGRLADTAGVPAPRLQERLCTMIPLKATEIHRDPCDLFHADAHGHRGNMANVLA